MSIKRLQDLLNINPSVHREPQRIAPIDNRLLQHAPVGQFPIPTNTGHAPLINPNLRNLPQAQSIFYDPLTRNEGHGQLNPMYQQLFHNLNHNNQMYYSQTQFEQENTLGLGSHNTHSEMLTSLTSILEAVKMSQIDPPKTLNELLQKSSSLSTHSNSLLQSQSPFMSSHSHASPMNGYGGYMSSPYANQVLTSDFSNLLSQSVLATPIQTPQQNFRPQQMPAPHPQGTNNHNNMNEILLQLTTLLKRDDGGNLREAVAQLIGGLPNSNLSQTRDSFAHQQQQQSNLIKLQRGLPPQNFVGQKELQGMQRTISLSNGLTMNSLNRFTDTRNHGFVDPQKTDIMGNMMKRDIIPSEPSRKGGNYSVIPEEDSGMQLDHSNSQERPEPFHLNFRPPSPNQSLNKQLNGLNLNQDTTEEHKEMNFSLSHYGGLATGYELSMIMHERIDPEGEVPGTYNREERTDKILKYKNKIRKWRHEHPITRKFKGRSVVAGKKPRIKGKFVSLDEYVEYIKNHNPNEDDPQAKELFNEISTYVESEKSAREINVKDENL